MCWVTVCHFRSNRFLTDIFFFSLLVEESSGVYCPSGILARLLSIVGHIAFKQLYHLDVSINNEMKRRENIQEEKKDGKKRKEIEKEKKRKSKDKVVFVC